MLGRTFRVFLLLFEALFLNVVIPGHKRGVITLDGKDSVHSLADLGCPFCNHSSERNSPTPRDRKDCAICHLALRLTMAPPVDLHLGELGLLPLLVLPTHNALLFTTIVSVQYCRGPPILFA